MYGCGLLHGNNNNDPIPNNKRRQPLFLPLGEAPCSYVLDSISGVSFVVMWRLAGGWLEERVKGEMLENELRWEVNEGN